VKFGEVPLNQFDLAMTNLAFSSVVLLGIRALVYGQPNKKPRVFYIFGVMLAG
jgi:hypothetical protein